VKRFLIMLSLLSVAAIVLCLPDDQECCRRYDIQDWYAELD